MNIEPWEAEYAGDPLSAILKLKTQYLLREIHSSSGLTWSDLYLKIDRKFPRPKKLTSQKGSLKLYINSPEHLRQLSSDNGRYLCEEFLPKLAQWALNKNWGGVVAKSVANYLPKTAQEKEDIKSERERTLALLKTDTNKYARKTKKLYDQGRSKVASELDEILRKMMQAGFSYADTLYMVNAWLLLNPPPKVMTAQLKFPLFFDTETEFFYRGVDVSSLPMNFVMHEHQSGIDRIYKIEFSAYPSTQFSEDDIDS